MNRRSLLAAVPALLLGACASPPKQGLVVSVAGVEAVPSGSSELRARVTLRIQNPNDGDVAYGGARLDLSLRGEVIGTGVTSTGGSLPRLGETLVPVTVTVTRVTAVRQAMGLYGAEDRRLTYKIAGSLASAGGGAKPVAFESLVELAFPGATR
jgi:LEA14-like dessication related protein